MDVTGRALDQLEGRLLSDPGGKSLVPPQVAVAQSPNAQAECQQQNENQKELVTFQRTILGTASINGRCIGQYDSGKTPRRLSSGLRKGTDHEGQQRQCIETSNGTNIRPAHWSRYAAGTAQQRFLLDSLLDRRWLSSAPHSNHLTQKYIRLEERTRCPSIRSIPQDCERGRC